MVHRMWQSLLSDGLDDTRQSIFTAICDVLLYKSVESNHISVDYNKTKDSSNASRTEKAYFSISHIYRYTCPLRLRLLFLFYFSKQLITELQIMYTLYYLLKLIADLEIMYTVYVFPVIYHWLIMYMLYVFAVTYPWFTDYVYVKSGAHPRNGLLSCSPHPSKNWNKILWKRYHMFSGIYPSADISHRNWLWR